MSQFFSLKALAFLLISVRIINLPVTIPPFPSPCIDLSVLLCLNHIDSLKIVKATSVQFSSVSQSCLTLCDLMNRSMPGLPVHHQLLESTQTHAHRVGDAIQPSHPLLSPSPPASNPSQHQGLFQWVNSSHEETKVLEFQLQHQSFQWTPSTDKAAY